MNVHTLSIDDINVIAHCALLPTIVEREVYALSNLSLHGLMQVIANENGDDLYAVRYAVQTYAARVEDMGKFQAAIRDYFKDEQERAAFEAAVLVEDANDQLHSYHN